MHSLLVITLVSYVICCINSIQARLYGPVSAMASQHADDLDKTFQRRPSNWDEFGLDAWPDTSWSSKYDRPEYSFWNSIPKSNPSSFYSTSGAWPTSAHLSPLMRNQQMNKYHTMRPMGGYKEPFVPKYMVESPQRSGQHSNIGELFVVLGPLVVLPLLSSLALSSFTTMFISKAMAPKQNNARIASTSLPVSNMSSLHVSNDSFPSIPLPLDQLHGYLYNGGSTSGSFAYDSMDQNNTLIRKKRHALLADQLGLSSSSSAYYHVPNHDHHHQYRVHHHHPIHPNHSNHHHHHNHQSFVPSTRPKMRRRSSQSNVYQNKSLTSKSKSSKIKKRPNRYYQPLLKSEASAEMPLRLNYISPLTLTPMSINQKSSSTSGSAGISSGDGKLFDGSSSTRFAAGDALLSSQSDAISSALSSRSALAPPPTNTTAPGTVSQIKRNKFISSLLVNLHSQSNRLYQNDTPKPFLDPFGTPNFRSNLVGRSAASSQSADQNEDADLDLLPPPVYRPESVSTSANQSQSNDKKNKMQPKAFKSGAIKINTKTSENSQKSLELASDLDVVQKYLQQTRPDGEYNDEVIATYLNCNGLLDINNRCLHRLVCQYADPHNSMPELEKEVSSLIIYAILKNKYIDSEFKQSLRQSAQFAIDTPGQCAVQYSCFSLKQRKH